MAYLNLASIRMCTESEGPGRRLAIWVQGCKKMSRMLQSRYARN